MFFICVGVYGRGTLVVSPVPRLEGSLVVGEKKKSVGVAHYLVQLGVQRADQGSDECFPSRNTMFRHSASLK